VPDYSFSVEPETRERKIDEVLRQLKSGVDSIQDSDNFREFLLTMSKFHDYSIGNLILIMLQKPEATRVAGYTTWKELGRYVRKGEKGIAILAPCMPPKETRVVEPEDEEDEEIQVETRPIYFKVVHVFDVSQTEGKELPEVEVPALIGEADDELYNGVLNLAKLQGLDVSFESRPYQDPAIKGMYSGKIIWVRPEESRAQQLKTLLHEMAHYYSEGVFRMPRRNAETIAESVAFTVGAHFGFDSGIRSFPYVALWAQDKKVLEQNLADIRKVSTKIIDALESKVSKVGAVA
jgi:antirestriction protein ArdC